MDVEKLNQVLDARFGATGAMLWNACVNSERWTAIIWMVGGGGISMAVAISAFRFPVDEDGDRVPRLIIGFLALIAAMMFIAGNVADIIWPQAAVLTALLGPAGCVR